MDLSAAYKLKKEAGCLLIMVSGDEREGMGQSNGKRSEREGHTMKAFKKAYTYSRLYAH